MSPKVAARRPSGVRRGPWLRNARRSATAASLWEIREAKDRGEQLGLNEDEVAFYDALETNDSAVAVLGDETLKAIAQELVVTVRRNATIDWSLRESARAKMRVMVKRLLKKYGYPPDKTEHATQLVLAQAEVVCEEWAA